MNYCNSCGNEIKDNSKFCSNCGVSIEIPKNEISKQKSDSNEIMKKTFINYKYLFIGLVIIILMYVGLRVAGYDIKLYKESAPTSGKPKQDGETIPPELEKVDY